MTRPQIFNNNIRVPEIQKKTYIKIEYNLVFETE